MFNELPVKNRVACLSLNLPTVLLMLGIFSNAAILVWVLMYMYNNYEAYMQLVHVHH